MALTKREARMTDREWFWYSTVPFWLLMVVYAAALSAMLYTGARLCL